MALNNKSTFTTNEIKKILHDCAILDEFEGNQDISALLSKQDNSLPDEALDAAAGGNSSEQPLELQLEDNSTIELKITPPSNFI